MSILAKKLDDINHTVGPEIGFRRSANELKKRQMLAIADVSGHDSNKIKSIAGSGVDAVFTDIKTLDSSGIPDTGVTIDNIPVGVKIDKADLKEAEKLSNLKYDYVLFDLETPIELIDKEGIGKILIIEPDLSPNMVRVINNLSISVDGVMLSDHDTPVTFQRLITCQLFAELLHKPLLVAVNSAAGSGDPSNLYQAGIKGVVLSKGLPLKAYTGIVNTIENLPKTIKRKTKGDALLPSLKPTSAIEEADDDEEDY